jgi:hypothetical protein
MARGKSGRSSSAYLPLMASLDSAPNFQPPLEIAHHGLRSGFQTKASALLLLVNTRQKRDKLAISYCDIYPSSNVQIDASQAAKGRDTFAGQVSELVNNLRPFCRTLPRGLFLRLSRDEVDRITGRWHMRHELGFENILNRRLKDSFLSRSFEHWS